MNREPRPVNKPVSSIHNEHFIFTTDLELASDTNENKELREQLDQAFKAAIARVKKANK